MKIFVVEKIGKKLSPQKNKITKNDDNIKTLNKKRKRKGDVKDNDYANICNEKQKNSVKPENIKKFINLTNDSYCYFSFDNTFCVFNSINDILYLIYSNKNMIISFNIIENKLINKIKNCNDKDNFITNFRHYLDIKNKRDLVISISAWGNNIKLWNINNWECLCDIKNVNKNGYLYSACFLNDNGKIYIISNNYKKHYDGYCEPIRVFNLNGNIIKSIDNSNENAFSINTYYDINLKKHFIITGNKSCVKSFDFNDNKLYQKYSNNGHCKNELHYCTVINDKGKIVELIESSTYGNIRIWNFHSGKLIKKIKINRGDKLFGICLWDEEHIYVGSEDRTIKLINIKNGVIKNNLIGHTNWVLTIKKIVHPNYGECLISQGYTNGQIKLIINLNLSDI